MTPGPEKHVSTCVALHPWVIPDFNGSTYGYAAPILSALLDLGFGRAELLQLIKVLRAIKQEYTVQDYTGKAKRKQR